MKKYEFDYNFGRASVEFEVTNEFTVEMAKATLEFFSWVYDESADPIDEVMKKYAIEAIREASHYSYNIIGVRGCFDNKEGYCKVDGSKGITIIDIEEFEFNEEDLEVEITIN